MTALLIVAAVYAVVTLLALACCRAAAHADAYAAEQLRQAYDVSLWDAELAAWIAGGEQ